jgi:thiamine kinase-like enzyme
MDDLALAARRLGTLPRWQGKVSIEALPGGITNKNFLVKDNTGRYVARICQELPWLGIDRRNEIACQTVAAELDVAPALIHAEQGLLISRCVPGHTLSAADVQDSALIAVLGKLLRSLHDGSARATGQILYFCPFQTIRTYTKTARKSESELPEDIDEMLTQVERLAEQIRPFRPVLCHNDLLPGNMIASDQRLWLVDWEYAGMGHPLFDLASVSANAGFSSEQDLALLEAYRGQVNPVDLDELHIFKLASSLREALWGLIQTVHSPLPFDYAAYAERHFQVFRDSTPRSHCE